MPPMVRQNLHEFEPLPSTGYPIADGGSTVRSEFPYSSQWLRSCFMPEQENNHYFERQDAGDCDCRAE